MFIILVTRYQASKKIQSSESRNPCTTTTVQEEIVRILDSLQSLQQSLESLQQTRKRNNMNTIEMEMNFNEDVGRNSKLIGYVSSTSNRWSIQHRNCFQEFLVSATAIAMERFICQKQRIYII